MEPGYVEDQSSGNINSSFYLKPRLRCTYSVRIVHVLFGCTPSVCQMTFTHNYVNISFTLSVNTGVDLEEE